MALSDEDRRNEIAEAIGSDLGQLLIADAEHDATQDHLAAVLRLYGWRCTPPATRGGE